MAIAITVGSSAGVNLNVGSSGYFSGLPAMFDLQAMNFGYFYTNLNSASEYGLAETREGSVFTGGAAMKATGNLSYSLSTHDVTGRLDTIAFGSELNGVTAGYGTTSTKMKLGTTDLAFKNLGLDAADGDAVNDILYGLMTGDASDFLAYLKLQSVDFTGGAGADSYQGGNRADTLSGMSGKDRLIGGGGNDTLSGGAGADRLDGNAGRDSLNGGKGADTLAGGSGADDFVFKSVADSRGSAVDTITDFSGSGGDRIDLSGLDADVTTAKNQAFDFIGTAAFSGDAGELRTVKSKTGTDVHVDLNGDKKSDFTLHFDDAIAFKASYFDL
jgi:Ca2+-binding RTX toxin-like protein